MRIENLGSSGGVGDYIGGRSLISNDDPLSPANEDSGGLGDGGPGNPSGDRDKAYVDGPFDAGVIPSRKLP